MDAGAYEPYIRVVLQITSGSHTVETLGFVLNSLSATVKIPYTTDTLAEEGRFRIVRGALINGIPVTISSIWFNIVDIKYDGRFITYTGEVLFRNYITVAANSDYETVINTALAEADFPPAPNYEGAAAWKAYQFYPTDRGIILNPARKLFPLLQQKYLVYATEDGWDGADSNIFFFVATQNRAKDYDITDLLFNFNFRYDERRLIWRDENNTINSVGNATAVIHNLGYLESTADDPSSAATPALYFADSKSSKLQVHLKYRTGDYVGVLSVPAGFSFTTRIKVTEILDLNSTPAWYQILETLPYFTSTEGGPIPSTLEAAAPYTPLVTTNFNNNLDSSVNNLQALAEAVDDLVLGSTGAPYDAPTATNDFLIGAQVAGVWTWVKNTLAQAITVLRTSLDSIYAAAAHTHEVDQRADMFSDAEGDPADIGTTADGTSTYAARRDHVHGGGGSGNASNYAINGGFNFAQRQTPGTLTTIADEKYGPDRWMLTRENADVQYQRNSAIAESGLNSTYYGLIKKITNAGKFMSLQVVEHVNSVPLRGQSVTFEIKMKASAAKTIRMAIIELATAGTADTLPATVISAWGVDTTDPTLGTNLAVVTSAESKSVTTAWQKFSVTKTIPSDSKNVILAFWSDSDFAANDTLSIAEAGLYVGSAPSAWTDRLYADELQMVQRFYEKTYNVDIAPGTDHSGAPYGYDVIFTGASATTAAGYIQMFFKVRKRIAPTMTWYQQNGTSGSWNYYGYWNGAGGTSAVTDFSTDQYKAAMALNSCSGLIVGTAVQLSGHMVADAEIY